MFVKNLFKPNDMVTPIPVGIPMVLGYNNLGRISKVYLGYERVYREDVTELLMPTILNTEKVPLNIDTGDITEIYGVLYTDSVVECCGKMPRANQNELINMFLSTPDKFTFYAGYAVNNSTYFGNVQMTKTWFKTHGFNTLPSILLPAQFDKSSFAQMVQASGFNFIYPLVMGYFIFRDGSNFAAYSNLTQITVENVSRFMNTYGVMFAKLEYGGTYIQIPYSEVVKHNIQSGCTVIFDSDNEIIYTVYLDGMRLSRVEDTLNCDWCHKPFKVSPDSLCRCDDSHCLSRRYVQFGHFIRTLGLSPLTYEDYKKNCLNGNVQALADILDIDTYAEEKIATTFTQLFEAIIPSDSGIRLDVVREFVQKCQNSKDSILYYIKNPNKIYEDFDFKDYPHIAFQKWLMDPVNNSDVLSVLGSPHINVWRFDPISTKVLKFEGARIYLLGKFDITDNENIRLTLTNYGGEVVDNFDEKVSLVIIGASGTYDSDIVAKANKLRIPVYKETVFFAHNGDLLEYINSTFNNYFEVIGWQDRIDG